VTESQDELKAMIREQNPSFNQIPPPERKRRYEEWYAVRLLTSLLGADPEIGYDDLGKPFLMNSDHHISISHSGEFVAASLHPSKRTGIDLELTGERIHRVKNKFINEDEAKGLKQGLETEMLYVIWGAKECAFKIYGKGGVDFREHLKVRKFEFSTTGSTEVTLSKQGISETFGVKWDYFGDLILVHAMADN
jgi:phosphopantetheinyl transferase